MSSLKIRKSILWLLLATLPTLVCMPAARAEAGDSCQVSDDCDPGERCKRGVCGPRQARGNAQADSGREQKSWPNHPVQQPSGGFMCCDQFGNSRCQIGNGPQAFGSSCFCFGQGYGFVCR